MSLTEVNLIDVVKKQFYFKFKAYLGSLISMVTVQVLAILFSFNGVGQYGMGGSVISLSIKSYSGSIIIGFTMFWAFIVAITLTTKPYRYMDFSFVTNRVSSHISTIALLVIYSMIGSITAMCSGILVRVIMYFSNDHIIKEHFHLSVSDLLISLYVATLYILLFAIVGYFIGMLVQLNRLFIFIIPAVIIGVLIYEQASLNTMNAFTFYFMEDSLFIFSVKIIFTIAILVCSIIPITNRLEVRK
ncbi:hypothetical protein [Fredinandcohnia quinoae]|uniref:ABC transporter permease n=1 Tax=Fredinandcohnia quinoae TaxID=2918902 RepID=A0AAW5DVP6_9BACI|nr:hypothetical protein [Fredinandcohnia sp. SECRCQ15]MCH1624088.1 hypothetical protein [Fredinandcohnia sp. SECRCQ15]